MTTTTNPHHARQARVVRAIARTRAQDAVNFWSREVSDTHFMITFHAGGDNAVAYLQHCKANLRAAQTTLSALSY